MPCDAGDGGIAFFVLGKRTQLKIGSSSESEKTIFINCQAAKGSDAGEESGRGCALCVKIESSFSVASISGNENHFLQHIQFGTSADENRAFIGPVLFRLRFSRGSSQRATFPSFKSLGTNGK